MKNPRNLSITKTTDANGVTHIVAVKNSTQQAPNGVYEKSWIDDLIICGLLVGFAGSGVLAWVIYTGALKLLSL